MLAKTYYPIVAAAVFSLARPALAGELAAPIPVEAADAAGAAERLLAGAPGLQRVRVRRSLTAEHVHYQGLAPDGSPVLGEYVSVHLLGRAPHYQGVVNGALPGPRRLEGARLLDAAAAGRLAAAKLGGSVLSADPAALREAPGVLRAGWRVVVDVEGSPPHQWEAFVDGTTGAARVLRDLVFTVDGVGFVFQPNPIAVTHDATLVDGEDGDSDALNGLRDEVVLQGLDGSGELKGDFADAFNRGERVTEASLRFDYPRSDDRFEEVNAYFHVDRVQRFLQSLGFTGDKAIIARPQEIAVNYTSSDQSFFSSGSQRIHMGSGGVDDAEDGDVIAHEYGHAVLDDIIPGFPQANEGSAIGEGFGDLQAVSAPSAKPVMDRACVAPWDAVAYSPPPPPFGCLRRVDGSKHYPEHSDGESHDDGEIWAGAMWELYEATGLGPELGFQLVVESLFLLRADADFSDSTKAILSADQALHGGAHLDAIRRVFTWRGLLSSLTPAVHPGEIIRSEPLAISSEMPIDDNEDEMVTIEQAGGFALRLHFTSLDMEVAQGCNQGCDNLYLYDGEGRLYARLSGRQTDFFAPAIPGEKVVVRWVSDRNVKSPGFTIDRVDVLAEAVPADAGVPDAVVVEPDAADDDGPDAGGSPDAGARLDAGVQPKDDGGCGCRAGGSRGGAGGTLLFVGLLLVFRAARRRA